jgi:hypothetical protein
VTINVQTYTGLFMVSIVAGEDQVLTVARSSPHDSIVQHLALYLKRLACSSAFSTFFRVFDFSETCLLFVGFLYY